MVDGSCELYEALCTITHARNFLGTIPGIFLMTMLPSFGKSRFEIAFVNPKFDGSYKEREASRDRWIDNLTSQAAFHALGPDGKSFFTDDEMELCVRCNVVTHDMLSWKPLEDPCGRTPGKSHHTTCPMHPSRVIKTMRMRARQLRNPLSRTGRSFRSGRRSSHSFMFHATHGNQIDIMQQGSKASSQDELTPFREDNTFTWHASTISSMMIRNQTQR